LPEGAVARQLEQFVDSGRVVMFFPPEETGGSQLFTARWGSWNKPQQTQAYDVEWWRGDSDLLAHGRSGSALPLDELKTFRYCSLESGGNPLARLTGGDPLLARAGTDRGAVYFCSTLPGARHSSLSRDGVVFYVMLQRALAQGADALASASQQLARSGVLGEGRWTPVASDEQEMAVSGRGLHAGVYTSESGRLVALNRPGDEDVAGPIGQPTLEKLLSGLNYERIDDAVDSDQALATEIWRLFLIAMVLALIIEAVLCLPGRKPKENESLASGMPMATGT
ncbi:MAG: hypothetical protein R3236_11685, partial [Phycisphaeraceae bacterium]|nr:hypothetical protein [Phycisphaeraceae bacterium]